MTVKELVYRFGLELDETIPTETILHYLNKAHVDMLNAPFKSDNIIKFEENDEALNLIRPLIIKDYELIVDNNNAKVYTLPINFTRKLRLYGLGELDECAESILSLNQIKYKEWNTAISEPFNRPIDFIVLYTIYGNNLSIEYDKRLTITSLKIDYVRMPKILTHISLTTNKQFSTNEYTEIPEITQDLHYELLELAKQYYLTNKQPKK